MRISRPNRQNIFIILCILLLMFFESCSPTVKTSGKAKQKPGLYDQTGWNSSPLGLSLDIDGKVGYKMELPKPRANCVSATNKWTGFTRIISGEFPPGIYIEDGVTIRGTPEQRGHYIAVVELYEIKCNENNYPPIKQELRFHITGSGIVNEGNTKELVNSSKLTVSYLVTQNEVKFFCKTNSYYVALLVDVNQNGVVDKRYDRLYGFEGHKILCAQYLIDDQGTRTLCGDAPTNAKLSVGSNIYIFSIPKSELSNRTGTASIMFECPLENDPHLSSTEYFPAGNRWLENTYKIDIR